MKKRMIEENGEEKEVKQKTSIKINIRDNDEGGEHW